VQRRFFAIKIERAILFGHQTSYSGDSADISREPFGNNWRIKWRLTFVA
jgi:hypothetical protein